MIFGCAMNYTGLCGSFEFINLIYKLIDTSGLNTQTIGGDGIIHFWESGTLSFDANQEIPKTRKNENLFEFLNKYDVNDYPKPTCNFYFSYVMRTTIGTPHLFSEIMNSLDDRDVISIIEKCLSKEDQAGLHEALMTAPPLYIESTPYNNLCANKPELLINFKLNLYNAISEHYKGVYAKHHDRYFDHSLAELRKIKNTSDTELFQRLFPYDANYGMLYKYLRCPIVLQNYFQANPQATPLFTMMADFDLWTNILRKDTQVEELESLSWCVINESKLYHPNSDPDAYRIGLNDAASVKWLMNQSPYLIDQIKKIYGSNLKLSRVIWHPMVRRKKMFLGYRDMICIIVQNDLKIPDNNLFHAFKVSTEKYDSYLVKEVFSDLNFDISETLNPNLNKPSKQKIQDKIQECLYGFLRALTLEELSQSEIQELYETHMSSCENTETLTEQRTNILKGFSTIPKDQLVAT